MILSFVPGSWGVPALLWGSPRWEHWCWWLWCPDASHASKAPLAWVGLMGTVGFLRVTGDGCDMPMQCGVSSRVTVEPHIGQGPPCFWVQEHGLCHFFYFCWNCASSSSYFVGVLVLGSMEPGGSPSHPQSLFHRLCYPLALLFIPLSPVCFGPSVQHRLDGYAGVCPWGAGPFPVWAHGSGRAAFAWLSILPSLCVSL